MSRATERELGRQPTADELRAIMEALQRRVARLDRLAFLAGRLSPAELDGLIQLAECALADRRALVGLDEKRAASAMTYALPDEVF